MKKRIIFPLIFFLLCSITCLKSSDNEKELELIEVVPEAKIGVFNGSGEEGIAENLGEKLIDEGYFLKVVENWMDYEDKPRFYFGRTVVFYNNELFSKQAEKLSVLLGVPVVDYREDLYKDDIDIGIIIGDDLNIDSLVVDKVEDEVYEKAYVVFGMPEETLEDGLYISKKNHTITLFQDGEIVEQFPCATGVDYSTPEGTFTITVKLIDPTWYWEGKVIPPGPENGLGSRFIGISKKSYGIHGTNEPSSIGRDASHGCVRMYNRDVEILYDIVNIGDIVKIGP